MELKNKYTIIIVTHNMQQAVRISDNTAFFLLGDLVEYGSTEQHVLSSRVTSGPRITSRGGSDNEKQI